MNIETEHEQPSLNNIHQEMYKELKRIPVIGALGLIAMTAASTITTETPLTKIEIVIGVGALTCIAVTWRFLEVYNLSLKATELSGEAHADFTESFDILTTPLTLEDAKQVNLLTTESPRLLTVNSQLQVKSKKSTENSTDEDTLALTLRSRAESLAETINLILPGKFTSLSDLHKLSQLFPVPTTERGILLTPAEKEVFLTVTELLPLLPAEQHAGSDSMIVYYQELINLYQQITQSYIHQTREDSSSADRTANWNSLSQAILAEKRTGQLVSPPIENHQQATHLNHLKENRFLISGEDAIRMSKQLVAMYFRAIPAVKDSARVSISFLRNECVNCLRSASLEERKNIEYIMTILNLTNSWSKIWDPGAKITNQELSQLFNRLQAVEQNELSSKINPPDNSPRGRIRHHSSRGEVTVGLDLTKPKNTSYIIEYNSAYYLYAEETATCIALMFPGVKYLDFKDQHRSVRVDMNEFYNEAIIKKNSQFLRSALTTKNSSLELLKSPHRKPLES